jgi:hypothetical protein
MQVINLGKGQAVKVLVEFINPADTAIVREKLDRTINEELGISFRAFFSDLEEVDVVPNNPFSKGKFFCYFFLMINFYRLQKRTLKR